MTKDEINAYGDELYAALRARKVVEPLTSRCRDISVDDAYQISLRQLSRRFEDGEKIAGKKIGATSLAVQKRFGVSEPDFGFLTDTMLLPADGFIDIDATLIQPMVEGELGFVLKRELVGPGVTAVDVIRATECVLPCIEVVDSRIAQWRIQYPDTVADNASSGVVVVGEQLADPRSLDMVTLGLVMEKMGGWWARVRARLRWVRRRAASPGWPTR